MCSGVVLKVALLSLGTCDMGSGQLTVEVSGQGCVLGQESTKANAWLEPSATDSPGLAPPIALAMLPPGEAAVLESQFSKKELVSHLLLAMEESGKLLAPK